MAVMYNNLKPHMLVLLEDNSFKVYQKFLITAPSICNIDFFSNVKVKYISRQYSGSLFICSENSAF